MKVETVINGKLMVKLTPESEIESAIVAAMIKSSANKAKMAAIEQDGDSMVVVVDK